MKTMRKIAWLLSFVLIVSSVVGNNYLKAEAQGDGTTFTVNVTDESGVTGNGVSYKSDSAGEWTSVSSGDAIDIKDASNITVKATASEGARVEASSGGGFAGVTDFGGISGENSQRFDLENEKSYILNVNFVSNNGGTQTNPTPGNGGLKLNISNRDSATGDVTYTFLHASGESLGTDTVSTSTTGNIAFPDGTAKVNIKVIPGDNCQVSNYGVNLDGQSMAEASKDAATGTEGNTITVSSTSKEYEVQVEFMTASGGGETGGGDSVPTDAISFVLEGDAVGAAIQKGAVQYSTDGGNTWVSMTSASASLGTDVSSAQIKVTDNDSAWNLQSFDIPNASVITSGTAYPVTEKKQYHIQIDRKVYTVIWKYDTSMNDDAFVEHGKVQIVSAVASGQTGQWSGIEYTDMPGANNNQQDEQGGRVAIIPGSKVTVKIVPEYKYQFTAGKLNDTVLTPDVDNVSTFTFIMPSTNLHLSALFTGTEDIMNVSGATGVTGAAITGGENIIDSGNLELTVKNFTDESKKNSLQASDAASGLQVSQWLEVDLKQVVKQGANDDYWVTAQDELPTKIKVTLTVGTGLDETKEYVVVREHNGVYERIPATYDKAAGTLSFESDKFSDYAVGTVVVKPGGVLDTINSQWPDGAASDASGTVSTLVSTFGVTGIAGVVQTSDGSVNTTLLGKLSALEEDYASEKNIIKKEPTVEPAVAGSINGTVKVIGAGFNVADGNSVQLVIGEKAGAGITVNSSYSKAVQLNICLKETAAGTGHVSEVSGDLRMPVTITMPVPTGIDASRLVILHDKDGDGTSDETMPYFLSEGKVTLTLTHCSNFAFAERTDSSSESNNGSGQSSSADTTVSEETVSVPVEYTVVRGDTLGRIARKNNMTLSALLSLNPQILNPNRIYPGQKIVIGYTGKTVNSASAETGAEYYIVQKGDYLYRIARKNGLTLNRLAALNPEIMRQKYIYVGQRIKVK